MALITRLSGAKAFGERGSADNPEGTKDEGGRSRPRPFRLSCGHVQLYQVLPTRGDTVYCREHQDYVPAVKELWTSRRLPESRSSTSIGLGATVVRCSGPAIPRCC